MSRTGTDVLLLINTGTPAAPVLEAVGWQRDATFTENTAEIDVSNKTSRDKRVLAGRFSTELTLDALYVHDNDGYEALVAAVRAEDLVMVARMVDGAVYGTGWGVVTSLSNRFPDQAESTVSATVVVDDILDTSTTNLITNPSFETNTTGWTSGGTNTEVQDGTEAEYGSWALLCTYQDNVILAQYDITLTAVSHTASVYVWVPTDYDGGGLELAFVDFTGATGVVDGTIDMTLRDQWQRVYAYATPDAADLSGSIQVINTGAAPTAGRFIYVDAAQVEAYDYGTPYCDGDQAGCEWTGVAHASTSTRD